MAHQSKSKMVNGHGKPRVNGSAHTEDAAREPEHIRKHISEISQVLGPEHFSKFVPINGPSRAEEDRIRQQRNFPSPRNIRNIGLFGDILEHKQQEKESDSEDEFFDENELRATIRSVNGRKGSDRFLKQQWTNQQYQKAEVPIVTEQKKVDDASESHRDVFARNVGMRSIVQQKKEKKVVASREESKPKSSAVNVNQDAENVGANNCRFPFIQDPIDPDFASRQFCGVDNKDDFIVEHVGKVVRVTPRQYMLENLTDADFAFSRGNK